MSVKPLESLGYWRGQETAYESALPILFAGYAFWHLKGVLQSPSMGKPLTNLELSICLGALVAVVSWTVSRQMYLAGKRKPVNISILSLLFSLGAVYGLSRTSVSGFETFCVEELKGAIAESVSFFVDGSSKMVCKIGGIPDSSYVPGTLVRPAWNGALPGYLWALMSVMAITSSVAFRDKRLIPSGVVKKVYKLLQYAPAAGLDGVLGEKAKDGRVQACANPTFWGEICGQMYSADKVFEPGEWCGRCNQNYVKAERELKFTIITLFTDNIDLLNALEKKDTLSWDVGNRIPADGRQSGVERWVELGTVSVPDVISVSQLLSIAHSLLPSWAGESERTKSAVDVAKDRASKLYGWIWFGRQTKRLTYARPTNKVLMALGTTRLRDLITDSGEDLYLQLDIGLLPVEMRTAFKKTFLDERRGPRFQNSKFDIWVPVAPKLAAKLAGLWVPRVEGEALRKWLSTGRLQEEGKKGVTVPRPYQVYAAELLEDEFEETVPPTVTDPEFELGDEIPAEQTGMELEDIFDFGDDEDAGTDIFSMSSEPEERPEELKSSEPPKETIVAPEVQEFIDVSVSPGTLDLIRAELNAAQTEPLLDRISVGDSIAEWEWLEPEQIQMLRQPALVLVDMTQVRPK